MLRPQSHGVGHALLEMSPRALREVRSSKIRITRYVAKICLEKTKVAPNPKIIVFKRRTASDHFFGGLCTVGKTSNYASEEADFSSWVPLGESLESLREANG